MTEIHALCLKPQTPQIRWSSSVHYRQFMKRSLVGYFWKDWQLPGQIWFYAVPLIWVTEMYTENWEYCSYLLLSDGCMHVVQILNIWQWTSYRIESNQREKATLVGHIIILSHIVDWIYQRYQYHTSNKIWHWRKLIVKYYFHHYR